MSSEQKQSETNGRKPVQTSELLASRLPFRSGFFVIGPFAGRVSFSSQQRRAISLACDIHRDLMTGGEPNGLKQKRVAIIGAGIAGLTAAITVAALGGRVDIFEKDPHQLSNDNDNFSTQVLPTIREAWHRDAHPTLNFWPHEDIEPFTRLPILNWHEDDCQNVATQIIEGFQELLGNTNIRNKITIVSGCEITGVAQDPQGFWMLERKMAEGSDASIDDMPYEIVFSATGFGKESSVPGAQTPSYWDGENSFVAELCSIAPTTIGNYVISGTGDGGLIETLRLLFKTTRPGNFDTKTMAILMDEGLRHEIAKIEKEAFRRRTDHILHARAYLSAKDAKELDSKAADELSIYLWDSYSRVVRNTIAPPVARDIQADRSSIKYVTLLGTKSHPMEISASPYHRILLTLAISKGWVKYVRVQEKETRILGTTAELSLPVGGHKRDLDIVTLRIKTHEGQEIDYERCFFLARHGTSSPLADLWPKEPENISRLKFQQELYADQDELQPRYSEMIAHNLGLKDPNDIKTFVNSMRSRVSAYFEKRFGLTIKFVRQELLVASGTQTLNHHIAVPQRLWGLEVKRETIQSFGKDGTR